MCLCRWEIYDPSSDRAEIFILALTANPYVCEEGGFPSLSWVSSVASTFSSQHELSPGEVKCEEVNFGSFSVSIYYQLAETAKALLNVSAVPRCQYDQPTLDTSIPLKLSRSIAASPLPSNSLQIGLATI